MKGPFAAIPVIAPDLAAAALQLARFAGILPAFFVRTDAADSEVSITPADIAAHEDAARLTIAAREHLPVEGAQPAELVALRTPEMPGWHVTLLIGAPDHSTPLVRLHHAYLTCHVLGSLKLDSS